MTENQLPPNLNLWWKHRRRMAYIALMWIIVQTLLWGVLGFLSPAAVASLGAVIGWSYGVSMAVLLGYFGNTLAEEVVKHKQKW